MSEAVQIDISVAQPQQAASVLEAMAAATEKLAKREAEYQEMLAKRAGLLDGMRGGPGGGSGYGRGGGGSSPAGGGPSGGPSGGGKTKLTDEEKYQQYLYRQIELLERRKRLEEDLVNMGHRPDANEKYQNRFEEQLRKKREREQIKEDMIKGGHVPAPLTGEDAYQDKLAKERARIEERYRMNRDLYDSGHKQDPAEKKEAERRKQEEKQKEAENRQRESDRQRTNDGVWLSVLAGKPVQAAATGLLGVGQASAAAIAGLYAVKSLTESLARIGHVRQSTYMPETVRDVETIGALPFGIGAAYRWGRQNIRDLTGATAQAQDMIQVDAPKKQLEYEAAREAYQATYPIYEQLHMARTKAGLTTPGRGVSMYSDESHTRYTEGRGSGLVGRSNWRGSVEGDREFEWYQRTNPAMISQNRAASNRGLAQSSLDFAEFGERQARLLNKQRGDEYNAIAREKPANVDEELNKQLRLKQALINAEAQSEIVQQRVMDVQRKQVQYATALHDEMKANVEVHRAELSLMQDKERRVQQRAQSTGGMNRVDLQLAINAAEIIKNHGLEAVTPEMREQARSVTPDYIRGLEEKQGEKNLDEYGFRQRLGGRDRDGNEVIRDIESLPEARQITARAQAKIEVSIAINEENTAKLIAKSLEDMVEKITRQTYQRLELKLIRIETGIQLGHASGAAAGGQ